MNELKELRWPLILGLGAFALLRPLLNIFGVMDDLGRPWGPFLITVGITAVWVGAGLRYANRPIPTLTCAGVTYGVLASLLSAVLSPILTGEFQGPFATPFMIGFVSLLLINAVWGAIAGGLVQLLRGDSRRRIGTGS